MLHCILQKYKKLKLLVARHYENFRGLNVAQYLRPWNFTFAGIHIVFVGWIKQVRFKPIDRDRAVGQFRSTDDMTIEILQILYFQIFLKFHTQIVLNNHFSWFLVPRWLAIFRLCFSIICLRWWCMDSITSPLVYQILADTKHKCVLKHIRKKCFQITFGQI